ncbi:hypothetical protein BU23DRAFT_655682 [Bimuria novae-zelandiae CBS 107.79]|uniref:Uncharacterized protein n=1 Tax=Bimuria novae-zelandiae CBS 107.79 TaxID=1447943 RepID=A0A6A5UUL7_9PLEO|nr:hypothetical protein BU23DRAFT_655682 [Bimuria novae-zelandiae CBS 107.79]
MSAAPADSYTPVLAENKSDDVRKALATATTVNSDYRPVEASRLELLPREFHELIYFYAGYPAAGRCTHSCEKKCRAFLNYERASKIVSLHWSSESNSWAIYPARSLVVWKEFQATPHVLEVNKVCAHPHAR